MCFIRISEQTENISITDWNQLPEGFTGTSHGKTHIFKTRFEPSGSRGPQNGPLAQRLNWGPALPDTRPTDSTSVPPKTRRDTVGGRNVHNRKHQPK